MCVNLNTQRERAKEPTENGIRWKFMIIALLQHFFTPKAGIGKLLKPKLSPREKKSFKIFPIPLNPKNSFILQCEGE